MRSVHLASPYKDDQLVKKELIKYFTYNKEKHYTIEYPKRHYKIIREISSKEDTKEVFIKEELLEKFLNLEN